MILTASQRTLWLLLLLTIISSSSTVQAGRDKRTESELTLERIFNSSDFRASTASVQWFSRGSAYTVLEPSNNGAKQIVRYSRDSTEGRTFVSADRLIPSGPKKSLHIDDYTFSADNSLLLIYTNSKRVWRQNTRGDYWVLDRSSHVLRQLGGDAPPASLMFAKFSPPGSQIAYVRDRNIYVEDLRDHSIRQLTRTDSPNVINGTFDWVYEEELSLRDGFRWSPDGKSIAYWQLDTSGVRKFPLVNNIDSLYPSIQWFAYPKVGQRNSACRVGVLDVDSGATQWLKVPGDPRNHYIARMQWIDNETLLIQQLNRLQNTNRVMTANPKTGAVTTLLTERDEAWVDLHDEVFWLADKQEFTWISDRDGWRHVYVVDRGNGHMKRITPGQYDVIELLHVNQARQCIYFLASPDNPCQQYLYSAPLNGQGLTRITPENEHGTHTYSISPDGEAALVKSSSINGPPRYDLVSLPGHDVIRTLEDNDQLRRNFDKLKRTDTSFFRIDIGDDVQLDGWCIRPPRMKAKRKYPLLIHVYGEPAGHTVVDRWGGNNYLWHLMLAQRGYVVMSFDNRGTPAPRGHDWRKCVYRKVGILGPKDQAAAAKAVLEKRSDLDPERVGVWGWSGGGSMTLNAMFKYPELYKTGIAIAPVSNMRYYDTIYQERYMGLPEDNVQGFRRGSPINFADQLQGNLLLIHGTGDDNCHYQMTAKLINTLVRHNKQFSMMAYPNRSHSIREGTGTTCHLRQLMTDYLIDQLPPGPR